MVAAQIRGHLVKQPFEPIRVFVSDGSYYDVCHPDNMLVSRTEIVIGLYPDRDRVTERNVYIDPVHITRIEPIDGKRPQRNSRKDRR